MIDYFRLNPLGEAIVRGAGGGAVLETLLGEENDPIALEEFVSRVFGRSRVGKVNKLSTFQLLPQDAAFVDAAPEAVVVLIDEIDKAPRDTPNDLLSEIEELSFSIPELGVRVTASPHYRPITILTSNEERALPGPFLRRCAFFNIPFPNTETLRAIVSQTLGIDAKGAMLESALDFVKGVRQNQNISKKPGTSEILAWLDVLRRQPNFDARRSLST